MERPSKDNQLGQVVRAQRNALGLSGQALAAAAGVDKAWLHRLEAGQIESPDAHKLASLARTLEMDPADLYLAAGFTSGTDLPAMQPYLRAKYDLPDVAIAQISEYVDFLNERYGGKEADDDTDTAA
jgi:transcriptional regulator with XRE-family HTH domain